MKKFSVTLLVTLLVSAFLTDAFAEPRRGGNGGHSVGPRSGRTAAPARRTRPTTRSNDPRRRRGTPRGNGTVMPGARVPGPVVRPGSRGNGRARGPVVHAPRRNGRGHARPGRPHVRPGSRHVRPGSRHPHYRGPVGRRTRPYVRYTHTPWRSPYRHSVRWMRPFNYYSYLRSNYTNYLYLNWIYYPSPYANGYRLVNGYPYFVYNGYRNRYSSYDLCNYQLVDTYTYSVMQSYWGMTCSQGYDTCAYERDQRNYSMSNFRYSCVETYRDQGYDFQAPAYNDGQYDGQYPEYNDGSDYCVDYDEQTNTCYDQ